MKQNTKGVRRKVGDSQNLVSRSEPEFTFQGPEDHPRGASYRPTADGFVATAPTSSWLMAIVFGGLLAFQASFLIRSSEMEKVPSSFYIALGFTTALTSVFLLFFTIGREQMRIKGEFLHLKRTILGVGFGTKLRWRAIQGLRVRRRAAVGRYVGVNTYRDYFSSYGGDTVIEVETNREIRMLGKHLRKRDLYYFRYLLLHFLNQHHPQAVPATVASSAR